MVGTAPAPVTDGLARTDLTDLERIEQGATLFDKLYTLFSRRRPR